MNPSKGLLKMTHSDYLAHPAYGASDIIKMGKSFAYFQEKRINPDPPGRPLVVGSAMHLFVQAAVTGDVPLLDGIAFYKEGSSLTKGFKVFQEQNKGKYCIDMEEYALCCRMLDAVMNDKEAMGYLKDAVPEATVMGKYPGTDILCKCRPDYLHQERGVSINLKTSSDASESGFLYGARDYGYDWQSAFYCAILSEQLGKPFDEVHIVIEKGDSAAECVVNIFSFGEDTLGFAKSQIYELMQKIPECERTGVWPKNPAFLRILDLPIHMRRVFG